MSVIVLRHVPGRGMRNVVVHLVKDYFGSVANEHFLKRSLVFVPAKQCQRFAINLRVDYLRVPLLMDGRILLYQVHSMRLYYINQIYIDNDTIKYYFIN